MQNRNRTHNMKRLLDVAMSADFHKGETQNKQSGFELKPGQNLNQYSIVAEIGRGGMGIVYKAVDMKLNRQVAIKIILTENNVRHRERLLREAQAIAQLSHPNIVQVFEVHSSPLPFLVMELVEGMSLDQFIKKRNRKIRGKQYTNSIAKIFIDTATALQFAHDKKIIHRDIKPENIMLDSNLTPKIMDFGLADREWDQVSVTGELVGTPMYMSPEQAKSRKLTRASDIYSLGATLYEALTARTIFQGDTLFNVMYQVMHDDPIRIRLLNSEISKDLEAICLKCIEKKVERRYKSMQLLASDLENYLEGKPVVAKPLGFARRIHRFIKRNKLLSATIFAVAIAFAGYVHKENEIRKLNREKEVEIAKKEQKLREKKREIASQEALIHSQKQELRQKNYFNLVNNLLLMKEHVYNGYIPTESPLEKAIENYHELGVIPDNNIEFRFLRNKYQNYTKKENRSSRYIFTLDHNQWLIVKNDCLVIVNAEGHVESKTVYENEIWVLHAALNENKTKLVIVARKTNFSRRFLLVYDMHNLKCIINDKPQIKYDHCYFYDNDTVAIGGSSDFSIVQIKNRHLKVKYQYKFPHNPFSTDINNVTSMVRNTKTNELLFVYSGRLYSYNDKKREVKLKHKIPGHIALRCLYNKIDNTVVVGTNKGRLLSVDEMGNIDIFEDKHKFSVKKISMYNGCIVTCDNQHEIFIWNGHRQVVNKIYVPENGLVDFTCVKNWVVSITKNSFFRFDLAAENPHTLHDNFFAINIDTFPDGFTTMNSLHTVVTYNFAEKVSSSKVMLFKPRYFFRHPKGFGELATTSKLHLMYNKNLILGRKYSIRGGVYDANRDVHYLYANTKIFVWSWKEKKIVKVYEEKYLVNNYVVSAYFDGNYLVMLFRFPENNNAIVHVFDTRTEERKIIQLPQLLPLETSSIQLIGSGKKHKVFILVEGKILVWSFDKFLLGNAPDFALENNQQAINCFTVAQKGERIIAIDNEKLVIWNSEKDFAFSRRLLLELPIKGKIKDCKYFSKHKKLVTIGEHILIWNFE